MREEKVQAWVTHPWIAEGEQRVRFGVSMMKADSDWEWHRDWVLMAEELGLDSYWMCDHPSRQPECWTTLAAMAVSTKKIRLGSLVSATPYRNPALLARIAADVDQLSHGRLILGLGIGDLEQEFAQLGLPFASVVTRQKMQEEAVQIIKGCWGKAPFL
jgi:alkanesulfonate monooxygenase SsuD/methylene tetrahydromethanopterin reductase-like flavin-dependent oxidoreductase (luciferase family)